MKKILRSAGLLAPVIMACGFVAQADQWNKHTKVTVNQSIEVPGAVLPAGTYIFRLVDSPSNRHVVQVFNEREDHIFATVIAIPNHRLEPTGETALSFYEVAAGKPQPVRAWFYPGDTFGQEFVYPKERNMAESTGATAIPAPSPVVAETTEPEPLNVASAEPAPEPAGATADAAPQVAANELPAAPRTMAPTPVMPQTATNVPLLALLGFLSIGAAIGLGAFAKRMG